MLIVDFNSLLFSLESKFYPLFSPPFDNPKGPGHQKLFQKGWNEEVVNAEMLGVCREQQGKDVDMAKKDLC